MAIEAEATPTLDAADVALVAGLGVRRQVREGEYLYREGDVTYDFFLLISAEVDIVVTADGGESVIAQHGPGRFLGELNMLTGLRVFVSARVVKAGEVVVVPRERLRQLMATKPQLGDTILAAFVARRTLLLTGAVSAIGVIGSQFSPESLRVREFLARTVRLRVAGPHRDSQVEELLRGFGISASELPVVIATGSVSATNSRGPGELSRADHREPARALLRPGRRGRRTAGLAAAVYGVSEGLHTLAVEMTAPVGQAGASSRIETTSDFPWASPAPNSPSEP